MADDRIAVTPKDFKKKIPVDPAYKRDIERARAEGKAEGRTQARKEVVDFLQEKYMDGKVSRKSPEGAAILKLTREIVQFMQGKSR